MATCAFCGKSGIFLTVDKAHLCSTCSPKVREGARANLKIYNDSMIYIKEPANPGEVKRCAMDIRAVLKQLIVLENKNLFSHENTMPSELLRQFEADLDQYYLDCFQRDFNELATQVANMKVKRYQVAKIEKFMELCDKYKSELKDDKALEGIISKVEKLKLTYSN